MRQALAMLQRGSFQLLAVACLLIGLLGVVVPLLPTTPFVLLALWLAMRSSPRLTAWIYHHPRFGPMVVQWREHGAIPRRAKLIAGLSIVFSAALIQFTVAALLPRLLAWFILAVVTAFIWTRPDTSTHQASTVTP